LDDKTSLFHVKAIRTLLQAAETPHKIPLVYELALRELSGVAWSGRARWHSVTSSFASLSTGFALYMAVPESGLMKVNVAVLVFLNIYLFTRIVAISTKTQETIVYLVKIRNQILFNHGYIPPIYRAKTANKEELDVWKKSMDEIDRDVLLGMDPNTASNEAVLRVQEYLDRCVVENGRIVSKPPSNRAGLVMDRS